MISIFPSTYFGPVSYFALLLAAEGQVAIDGGELFQKQTVRNRCEILGANGPLRMTVPLIKWSTKIPIRTIQIDNSGNWQHVHWMSLVSAYKNAAYFDHYEEKVKAIYKTEFKFLIDLNEATFRLVLTMLKSELDLTNIGATVGTENMISYENRPLFRKKRPDHNLVRYQQVFSDRFPFVADLSILDLIFNMGPQASFYLRQLKMNGQP